MTLIRISSRIERADIGELIAIDNEWYGSNPSETHLSWAYSMPWMYSVLATETRIEGYVLVIPVDQFSHQALKRGDMTEDEIVLRRIRSVTDCSGVYLASVAAHEDTDILLRKQLVGLAQGQVLRLPRELFAVTVSPPGERIALELGMVNSPYKGQIQGLMGHEPKLFTKDPFSLC